MKKHSIRITCGLLLAASFAALAGLVPRAAHSPLPLAQDVAERSLTTPTPRSDQKALYSKASPMTSEPSARTTFRLMHQVAQEYGTATAGLYVPQLFGLPILPQPEGQDGYVSAKPGRVTAFGLAARHGVVGLLAHNFLAGELFYQLELGQQLWIARSPYKRQTYEVVQIDLFQKLQGRGATEYRELSNGRVWSTAEIFGRYYTDGGQMVLQTCLEREGRLDWGLTFIVAVPLSQ